MPEDNNIDDLSISEILDLYKDTIEKDDELLGGSMCPPTKSLYGSGADGVSRVRI